MLLFQTERAKPLSPGHARRSSAIQLLEVIAFLVVISPLSALLVYAFRPQTLNFAFVASASMVRDILLVGIVVWLLRRNGEPLSSLGLTGAAFWREVRLGVLLFPPFFFGTALLQMALRSLGLSGLNEPPPYLMPIGPLEIALGLLFILVVAVSEETIFRGYLLLRLRAITRSPAAALALSSLVFALGHGYQGSAGVVTVGTMGVLLGLVYLWRGSLTAPVVMHFLQNFVGIVVVPLLAAGA